MAALTQLPDVVDLSFVAGDTFRIRVNVTAPNAAEPEPLADYDFCAQIAQTPQTPDRTDNVVGFAVTPDPDNPDQAVILTLEPDDTDGLLVAGVDGVFNGVWDLEVTFPLRAGQTVRDVRTVVKGSVTCVLDVSKLGTTP